MISISFPQPCKPLTMNQRMHWAAKAKVAAQWRERATWSVLAHAPSFRSEPMPLGRSVVQVVFPVHSLKVRRDPHNWYPTVKAVVDGLVDAGLWPDDTPEYLMTIEPDFKQGADVEVRIWERGEWLAAML